MATYIDIHGANIPIRSSDPSNPVAGQIWYNTTTNLLKGQTSSPAGAWSTGNTINTARTSFGGAGTTTAGLAMAGQVTGPGANTLATEEYDGTSWVAANNMVGTARRALGGSGTQTDAITCGGYDPTLSPGGGNNNTEIYDGTSWSAGGTLNTGRYATSICAAATPAGLSAGGTVLSVGPGTYNEEYNGSSWTSTAAFPMGLRSTDSLAGIQTAALYAGGTRASDSVRSNLVSDYDGTSWSAGTVLPATRTGASQSGTATDALVAFGSSPAVPGNYTSSLHYDGSAWTTRPNSNSDGDGMGYASNKATSTATWVAGLGPSNNATEEFTSPASVVVTISSS
tara:strand:+ start:2382 stop:3401 length:1020 start_codon:yes stop_codon:yes gene_type:complete